MLLQGDLVFLNNGNLYERVITVKKIKDALERNGEEQNEDALGGDTEIAQEIDDKHLNWGQIRAFPILGK